jgi:hypothetical protein
MATATVERIYEERIEDFAPRVDRWLTNKSLGNCVPSTSYKTYCYQVFQEQTLIETKELAVISARAAGLIKEADLIEDCGTKYAVYKCDNCGDYTGHPYHCNQRLCPKCYYRNLFRFMNRHCDDWDKTQGFTLITIDHGGFRQYDVEDGMDHAREIHKSLIKAFPLLWGGIYHIQLKYDDDYHRYRILYHYLINGHVNYAFLFTMALNGQSRLESYKSFEDYDTAQSYFIRYPCQYPSDILLDYKQVGWYLSLTKRHKLIQGFGTLYRVTGGLNRTSHSNHNHVCPYCGSETRYVGFTTKEYVSWDEKNKSYLVDPGAPGLEN